MSDEPTKYVLRPKVVIEEYKGYVILRASKGSSFRQEIPNAVFDKLFVPVFDLSRENQPEEQRKEIWESMIYSIIVPGLNSFTYDQLQIMFKDALTTVATDRGDVE